MSKLIDAYFQLLRLIIVFCLFAMVAMVFANVVMRYAFNSGLPVSEELSRWAFVWLTFLGSILVLKDHAHLGVDIVIKSVGPATRKVCMAIAHLLMIYITWLITVGSWEQTLVNSTSNAPASGLSLGWLFGVGIVFGASTLLMNLYHLYLIVTTPATGLDALFQSASRGEEQ